MKKSLSRRILELLRESQGASIREISATAEIPPEKARAVLYELKAKGYVERVGKVYIITERGRRFLEYIEHTESVTARPEAAQPETQVETRETLRGEKPEVVVKQQVPPAEASQKPAMERETGISAESIMIRLSELEKRILNLEKTVKDLEKAIELLQRRRQGEAPLEFPVIPYSYATAKLGSLLDKLLAENKLVRVGSLIIDAQFYAEFRSRFPIKVSDLDKLAPHEKALLEEMRKEALVILHAGREYRLVD